MVSKIKREPYDEAATAYHRGTLPVRPGLAVVCLDLDGVLSPFGPEVPAGFVEHRFTMRAEDLPKSLFIRGGGKQDTEVRVLVNAELGKWVSRLRERADVYWSTTWEGAANIYFAPLLGIGALPVIEHSRWSPTFGDVKDQNVGHWKQYAIRDLFADRALVWIDDAANGFSVRDWRGRVPTLVVQPWGDEGITEKDRGLVDSFVEQHSKNGKGIG